MHSTFIRHLLLAASALALGSCATSPLATSAIEVPDEAELFGDFLAGTYASNVSAFGERTDYYSRAYARAPEDIYIGRRALGFAILDGDMELARTLATAIVEQDSNEPMARMVLGEQAFVKSRPERAARFFDPDTSDLTMGIAMDLMSGWSDWDAGNEAAAVETFEQLGGGAVFSRLGELQLATVDARAGRTDEALSRLDTVDEAGLFTVEATLARARILSRAGRTDEALEMVRDRIEATDDPGFGPLASLHEALEAGEVPQELTARQLASRALTEPSYQFFRRNGALDAAELYLRVALDLDGGNDKAKIWLANLLEIAERTDEARELYTSIAQGSPYHVSARLSQATLLFADTENDEDYAQGLAILEDVNARYPSIATREALGRARLFRDNYAEALPIYDALIASLSDEELEANTQPLFFRGVINTELDDFPAAVADFQRVLSIEPDDADALNYLGYSWVDRGENLEQAFDMIERAVELEPNSGAIIDSLGWAHYKLGRYGEARRHLETAAQLSPGAATIIDHLGDVYWKLGRLREARYQWKRALTLDPTDDEVVAIEAKLRDGLVAATLDAAP